jgi:hypothetical protein
MRGIAHGHSYREFHHGSHTSHKGRLAIPDGPAALVYGRSVSPMDEITPLPVMEH